jgi:hypothetical protein
LAAGFGDRAIHLAGFILKDPKLDNALRQHVGIFGTVFLLHAKQNEDSRPYS